MGVELMSDNAVFSDKFLQKLIKITNRRAPTLAALPAEEGVGSNVVWGVEISGSSAAGHAPGATIAESAATFDANFKATLPWGYYQDQFSISDQAIMEASTYQGNGDTPKLMVNLFENAALNAIKTVAKLCNGDLFNGQAGGVNQLIGGLISGSAALSTTSSYASLSPGNLADWKGTVIHGSSAAAALKLDDLWTLYYDIFDASGEYPDMVIVHPKMMEAYQSILCGTPTFFTDASGQLNGPTATYRWNQMPIIVDSDAPKNKIIMLNSEYIVVKYIPWNMREGDQGDVTAFPLFGQGGDNVDQTSVMAYMKRLPDGGNSRARFKVGVTIQLQVTKRSAHGYLDNVTIPT